MELRQIPVVDIYPDEKNPRKDFGDIKALAESFDLNAIHPGEPVNPIVVVQDGGIYRIVDGERRYRAMVSSKLSNCHAVVCEDMDEANTQIAMLTTNDKQPLTPIEISRGVQQQLLLGVDPIRIEKAARMKAGDAMKAATARALVDDAAEDMTLDRLYAIAEFGDDPEAIKELSNCQDGMWRSSYSALTRLKKNMAVYEAVTKACKELEVKIETKAPKGSKFIRELWNIDEENAHEQISEQGQVLIVAKKPEKESWRFEVAVHSVPEKVSEKEAAKIKSDNAIKKAMSADKKRRAVFAGEKLVNEGIESLEFISLFFKNFIAEQSYYLSRFLEKADLESVPINVSEWMVANFWESADDMSQDTLLDITKGGKQRGHYCPRNSAKKFFDLMDALQKDGYEVSETESNLIISCENLIEESEEADYGQDQ